MKRNWILRTSASVLLFLGWLWESPPVIRAVDDPWYPDTDNRRMHQELAAMRSRFPDHA